MFCCNKKNIIWEYENRVWFSHQILEYFLKNNPNSRLINSLPHSVFYISNPNLSLSLALALNFSYFLTNSVLESSSKAMKMIASLK